MISKIYKRVFKVIAKKPLQLLGVSLLGTLLTSLSWVLFGVVPGIALGLTWLINVGMVAVYLKGYRGEGVDVDQIFLAFKDGKTAKHVLAGMGWQELWIFIWGLIPVAGPIIALIKGYEYSLTPYILIQQPEVSPREALKVSMKKTENHKWHMLLAEFVIPGGIIFAVTLLLLLFSLIPVAGIMFSGTILIVIVACAAFLPFFQGLVHAAFYEEIMNPEAEAMKDAGIQAIPVQPVDNAQPVNAEAENAPTENN